MGLMGLINGFPTSHLLIKIIGVLGRVPPVPRIPSGQKPLIAVFHGHLLAEGEAEQTSGNVIEEVDTDDDAKILTPDAERRMGIGQRETGSLSVVITRSSHPC